MALKGCKGPTKGGECKNTVRSGWCAAHLAAIQAQALRRRVREWKEIAHDSTRNRKPRVPRVVSGAPLVPDADRT